MIDIYMIYYFLCKYLICILDTEHVIIVNMTLFINNQTHKKIRYLFSHIIFFLYYFSLLLTLFYSGFILAY